MINPEHIPLGAGMHGLKNVRNRRSDALTQVGWEQLEVMLAVYYRSQGYRVEHVGTAGSGARFDGGIDLKLYKDDAYIVVQCKHWNAKQVTHNAVHELLGVMITQSATGAILVTSGEFTRAAIEAATKQGHVQLVDGDDLRAMLGPLPDVPPDLTCGSAGTRDPTNSNEANKADRFAAAAEESLLRRGPVVRRQRGKLAAAMHAGLGIVLIKLAAGLIIVLGVAGVLKSVLFPLKQATAGGTASAQAGDPLPRPQHVAGTAVVQAGQPLDPLATAARFAEIRGNAIIGNQQGVQRGMDSLHEDFRKSIKLADPSRRVDREAARSAARNVEGVRSVVWIDHENLLAIVARNAQRSQATIDAICMQLEPLGDTLGVVVNLQSGEARTGDELEILSRNCQLTPGDRAFLQRARVVDAIDPAIRAQHRANTEWAQAQQGRKKEAEESARILKASTPEM